MGKMRLSCVFVVLSFAISMPNRDPQFPVPGRIRHDEEMRKIISDFWGWRRKLLTVQFLIIKSTVY